MHHRESSKVVRRVWYIDRRSDWPDGPQHTCNIAPCQFSRADSRKRPQALGAFPDCVFGPGGRCRRLAGETGRRAIIAGVLRTRRHDPSAAIRPPRKVVRPSNCSVVHWCDAAIQQKKLQTCRRRATQKGRRWATQKEVFFAFLTHLVDHELSWHRGPGLVRPCPSTMSHF